MEEAPEKNATIILAYLQSLPDSGEYTPRKLWVYF